LATGVSADGSVVVGSSFDSVPIQRAFRWRRDTGMIELPRLPGWPNAAAASVSGDGATVAGFCYDSGASVATLWSPALGVADLHWYLPTLGVDLTGWTLTSVNATTPDGLTLVGNGLHNGHLEGWIATIPRCGSADFDRDGTTGTDADIEAFFACLAGNCCASCGTADFNGDSDVGTDADIESFFRVLAGGSC
jgi:probable HAF family extracellular repeat protein